MKFKKTTRFTAGVYNIIFSKKLFATTSDSNLSEVPEPLRPKICQNPSTFAYGLKN